MHDDTIEIAQPATDTDSLRAWIRPVSAAFADDYTDAMFDVDMQLWEKDRLIGGKDGDRWVGGASAGSMRLTIPGGTVRAAGISDVGVAPTHRRRGILTGMMRWLLDQAADRGEPVSILHASEGAIYPRFGFGLATLQGTFEADVSAFAFREPAEPYGRVRIVEGDEAMRLVPPLFEAVVGSRVGEVSRPPDKWRLQLLADDPWRRNIGIKFTAVLEVAGEPRGYVIYRVKSDWGDRGPKNVLTVMEVTGLDPAAERALWEWLASVDLVRTVAAWRQPVPPPLFLQLRDPRRLGLMVGDGLWVRLVDLPAALAARSYAGPGELTFEVTDAFMPANAGLWTMSVPGDRGEASVTRAAAGVDPDLRLDTTDLAAAYLGAFTFTDLVRAGRLAECRAGAVAAADRLFATTGVVWSSTMF
ncbi:MAG: GNAT family N-acetyltransferase [Chloroflexota bacterium]